MLISISEVLETPVSTLLGETIVEPKADDLKVLTSKKQTHFPTKITYRERIRFRKIVEKLEESEKEKGSSA